MESETMGKRSKKARRALRAAFVVTASAGAVAAAGCGSTSNPPEVFCPEEVPQHGFACTNEVATGDSCSYPDGCGNLIVATCGAGWEVEYEGTCNPPPPTCDATTPCDPGFACSYPDGLCGTGLAGECVPKPMGCVEGPPDLSGACGCNGVITDDDFGACGFGVAGLDTWDAFAAPCVEVAQHPCGNLTCTVEEYCRVQQVPAGGTQEACYPLAPTCDLDVVSACDPSCVGNGAVAQGCTCTIGEYGHPTLTCPVG